MLCLVCSASFGFASMFEGFSKCLHWPLDVSQVIGFDPSMVGLRPCGLSCPVFPAASAMGKRACNKVPEVDVEDIPESKKVDRKQGPVMLGYLKYHGKPEVEPEDCHMYQKALEAFLMYECISCVDMFFVFVVNISFQTNQYVETKHHIINNLCLPCRCTRSCPMTASRATSHNFSTTRRM